MTTHELARVLLSCGDVECPGLSAIIGQRFKQSLLYSEAHDDAHTGAELIVAGNVYGAVAAIQVRHGTELLGVPASWPFEAEAFHPDRENPVNNLAKAAAFYCAEIDRLTRAKAITACPPSQSHPEQS